MAVLKTGILLTMKFILLINTFLFFNTSYSATGVDAIYRADNRQFVTFFSAPKIKKLSQSLAMIINKDSLRDGIIQTEKLTDPNGSNICPDEDFADSTSVHSCTGFLVGKDLIASAGHCFMTESDCAERLVVFGVLNSTVTSKGYKINLTNVYECKEIVASAFADTSADFSIIRLTKKVKNIAPLKVRETGSVGISEKVFMLGHPLGMPLMLSNKATVTESLDSNFFRADLDSFVGNSGSPVFNNDTLEVEGILVRGQDDFNLDVSKNCNRLTRYVPKVNGVAGEDVTRINAILPTINGPKN